mgnify:CR=1 FL=1
MRAKPSWLALLVENGTTTYKVENGKELVIFELHMSAYGNSDAIREGQISMLCNDMEAEYEAGNYVSAAVTSTIDLKAIRG